MDQFEYVGREYLNGRSTNSLGIELGKNPKVIRDMLKKMGIKLRNHSQAQSLNIKKNGPPISRPRTDEEKKRISEGQQKSWDERKNP
jgi:hypothetical protein